MGGLKGLSLRMLYSQTRGDSEERDTLGRSKKGMADETPRAEVFSLESRGS